MSAICGHCKRSVDEFEGIVDEFIWYHDHCYYLIKSKRMDVLQKKFDGGTITLNQAEELSELIMIVRNVKKHLHAPKITRDQIFNTGRPKLFGKSDGLSLVNEHIIKLKNFEAMEAKRSGEQNLLEKPNPLSQLLANGKH